MSAKLGIDLTELTTSDIMDELADSQDAYWAAKQEKQALYEEAILLAAEKGPVKWVYPFTLYI